MINGTPLTKSNNYANNFKLPNDQVAIEKSLAGLALAKELPAQHELRALIAACIEGPDAAKFYMLGRDAGKSYKEVNLLQLKELITTLGGAPELLKLIDNEINLAPNSLARFERRNNFDIVAEPGGGGHELLRRRCHSHRAVAKQVAKPLVKHSSSIAKQPQLASSWLPPLPKIKAVENGVMFQYFEWYLPNNQTLWSSLAADAAHLKQIGISAVWIPPAYKGHTGAKDVGYGVYDKYDLGEFAQKGTVPTKHGHKHELVAAINALHAQHVHVYGDIVLNHIIGGDELETLTVNHVASDNRNHIYADKREISAFTKYTYPGRNKQYSSFEYDHRVIKSIDDESLAEFNPDIYKLNAPGCKNIYKLIDHEFNYPVDTEYGNHDYLLGGNLDYNQPQMVAEAKSWGSWYTQTLKLDGYRIDAVKHIKFDFMHDWLGAMRQQFGLNKFAVGEYWSGNLADLENYKNFLNGEISLFDVPLHFNLYKASTEVNFDLRKIFEKTLVGSHPCHAVTFVDNHDSEPDQSLESFISPWFKPLAYALILTRKEGYPCVFYGDYYGIPSKKCAGFQTVIDDLLTARTKYAYGEQHDYFVDPNYIGWVRSGDEQHRGLATVISSGDHDGYVNMQVGAKYAQELWRDITHNHEGVVQINEDGWGHFLVKAKSVAVWVPA